MADPVQLTLGRPFAEQVAAFRVRLGDLRGTRAWDDLRGQEHDRAFMVAGAMKADLLADLAAAVDQAVLGKSTLETFRKEFRGIVEKHGWHGWTGEGSEKGEAWRTRVIYRTNMATSYAAGRHAQLTQGGFAWWVYRHGGSEHPRLHHLAWDGVALPPDDPFWASHYPPNGWGCSCRVAGARTEAGIRRVGGDPDKSLPPGWDAVNARTGTPVGIDKGWNHAPGRSVTQLVQDMAAKAEKLPAQLSADMIRSWLQPDPFGTWMTSPEGSWPVGRLPDDDAELISAKTRVLRISATTMEKQTREHPELTAFDYAEIQRVIDERTRRLQDSATTLVYTFEPEGHNGHVLVVKATRTGEGLYVTSFRRISADDKARKAELARLLTKAEKWSRT